MCLVFHMKQWCSFCCCSVKRLRVSSTNMRSFFLPQNQKLHIENRLLREKTSGLLTENEELRQRLCLDTLDSKEKVRSQCGRWRGTGSACGDCQSFEWSNFNSPSSRCFCHRFKVCCPPGTKQIWGSGLLSPQHSGYVCLRSRCRPSSP